MHHRWEAHHEMTNEEIARELNMKPAGVKQALRRAMKKLRDGRAVQIKDLAIAREKEVRYGLPRIME